MLNTYHIVKYLHLLFLFIMIGSVVAQQFMIAKKMSGSELKRIAQTDLWYGISAILVVAMGLTLWFGVGKPSDFYTHNHLFLVKTGLFILVGLLSVYPTLFFRKQSRMLKEGAEVKVPPSVILVVRLELLILMVIPLLAVLMASGVGRMT